MNYTSIIASGNWIPFFKPLAVVLGDPDPAIVLSELANRYEYHSTRGTLTKDGWFYATVDDVQNNTSLSKHRQAGAIKKLEGVGLLLTELRGSPPVRHCFFPSDFDEKLVNILNIFQRLKNLTFKGEDDPDIQRLKNLTFKGEKFSPSKVKKFNRIDTTVIDTTGIDTTLSSSKNEKENFDKKNEIKNSASQSATDVLPAAPGVDAAGGANAGETQDVGAEVAITDAHKQLLISRFNQFRDALLDDSLKIEEFAMYFIRLFPGVLVDRALMEEALDEFYIQKKALDELVWKNQKDFNKNVFFWLNKNYLHDKHNKINKGAGATPKAGASSGRIATDGDRFKSRVYRDAIHVGIELRDQLQRITYLQAKNDNSADRQREDHCRHYY